MDVALDLYEKVFDAFPSHRRYLIQNIQGEKVLQNRRVYQFSKRAVIPTDIEARTNTWFGLDDMSSYTQNGEVSTPFHMLLNDLCSSPHALRHRISNPQSLRSPGNLRNASTSIWPSRVTPNPCESTTIQSCRPDGCIIPANAEYLLPMVLIALNDLTAAQPFVQGLLDTLNERHKREEGSPWPDLRGDYAVYRASLKSPDAFRLYGDGRQRLRTSLQTHFLSDLRLRFEPDCAQADIHPLGTAVSPDTASALKYWFPASTMTDSIGFRNPWWEVHEDQIAHISGSTSDLLYFAWPLEGNFEFFVDSYSGPWAETDVSYGGILVQAQQDGPQSEIVDMSTRDLVVRPQGLKRGHRSFNRVRLQSVDGRLRYLLNDHLVYEEPLSWTPQQQVQGRKPSLWLTRAREARHLPGGVSTQLYFRSPLRGQFSISAECTVEEFSELAIVSGAHAAVPARNLKAVRIARALRQIPFIDRQLQNPSLESVATFQIEVDGTRVTTQVNGHQIHQEDFNAPPDPWLLLQPLTAGNQGSVRNLQILGTPVIPSEIDLIDMAGLADWRADIYGDSIQSADSSGVSSEEVSPAVWKRVGDELIGSLRTDVSARPCESLLRYQRPLLEDAEIEFEMFLVPGEFEMHPAIGRTAVAWNGSRHVEGPGLLPDGYAGIPDHDPV